MREVGVILQGDAGVAALVLVVAADVGAFVGVVDGNHVVTHLGLELADGDGLPALGFAEVVVGGEQLSDGYVAGGVRRYALGDEVAHAVGFTEQGVDALALGVRELDVAEPAELVEQVDGAFDTPVEDAGALGPDQLTGEIRDGFGSGRLGAACTQSTDSRRKWSGARSLPPGCLAIRSRGA